MVRTQIQLNEEQMQELKALATEGKVSVSELIRQSVGQLIAISRGILLSERCKRAIAIPVRLRSGDPVAKDSINHDDYLADIFAS